MFELQRPAYMGVSDYLESFTSFPENGLEEIVRVYLVEPDYVDTILVLRHDNAQTCTYRVFDE